MRRYLTHTSFSSSVVSKKLRASNQIVLIDSNLCWSFSLIYFENLRNDSLGEKTYLNALVAATRYAY